MNNDDEREKLASMMNQEQTYIQCIVQTGYTQSMPDEFMSIVRDGKTTTTTQQQPYVPVCQYDYASTD